jgi:hypothetical protein
LWVFKTTPTWIPCASVGFTGRISTAITRNIGKRTWLRLLPSRVRNHRAETLNNRPAERLLRTSVRDREYRYYIPT